MLVSIVLIISIAFGGLALTYLLVDDEPFIWRLAAGNIIGSAIFGIVAFVIACLFGLTTVSVLASLAITLLPLILLRQKSLGDNFKHDWAKAKGKLQGGGSKRLLGFSYYAFFILVFWLFFGQTMYETSQGIFTGGSQNLGDLPFHLGAIFSFTDGANFPPQNPSFSGARFSYPFIADFLTACFIRLGASVTDALHLQNVSWAFSLLVILERFAARLTGNKLAGRIAPFLLFFSGGLGFIWFFRDYWAQGKGIVEFLWALPQDYTIGDQFRWGNSMAALFMTQRSLLLGMPLTVVVLGYIWKIFATESRTINEEEIYGDAVNKPEGSTFLAHPLSLISFIFGLLAGLLPLIHLHSLAVLFVVTGFCFVMRPARWREWLAFGVGVALIAVPELIWSVAGSASETSKFFSWHFGWDKRDTNILWFWLKNTGIVIPLICAGGYLIYLTQRRRDTDTQETKTGSKKVSIEAPDSRLSTSRSSLLLFYIPFIFLFLISNVAKLAPWEWDNIKVLIYWYVGSLPLIAYAVAWAWRENRTLKVAAGAAFAILIFAGSLDVWRTISGKIKYGVFDTDAVAIAEQIKAKTAPNALFLNAPTYNSAVVLSGRRSFMRYSGHLSSHGIDYTPRENEVRSIYAGGGVTDILLRKNNIEYVLISPIEHGDMKANDEFFKKYPIIAESGQYRVYQIKQ